MNSLDYLLKDDFIWRKNPNKIILYKESDGHYVFRFSFQNIHDELVSLPEIFTSFSSKDGLIKFVVLKINKK